jgi:hypothetical protein
VPSAGEMRVRLGCNETSHSEAAEGQRMRPSLSSGQ